MNVLIQGCFFVLASLGTIIILFQDEWGLFALFHTLRDPLESLNTGVGTYFVESFRIAWTYIICLLGIFLVVVLKLSYGIPFHTWIAVGVLAIQYLVNISIPSFPNKYEKIPRTWNRLKLVLLFILTLLMTSYFWFIFVLSQDMVILPIGVRFGNE